MSSNAKQQSKGSPSAAAFQQGQRNLKKRDFKQALKDARLCFRQSPNAEHRIFLEQASFGRARELDLAGLKPQAQDIIQELLVQPVQDPEVRQALPELLSRVGILDKYPEYRQRLDDDPALKLKMMSRAADMAVVHPDEAKNAAPEIRQGAALVVAALEKLDAGEDTACVELLKDIGRQSPFADWRLFVRGLAAFYRSDLETAAANWSRLDPERLPMRLTRLLQAIRQGDFDLISADPALANAFGALESTLWGAPLLSELRSIKSRAASGDWLKAVTNLRNIRDRLRVVDPETLQAVTEYLRDQAIRTKNRDFLKDLTFSTDALAWDPNWNHARAQLAALDDDASSNELVNYWSKYLDDLTRVTCWSPEEIQLAQAIVLEHIGKIYRSLIDPPTQHQQDRPVVTLTPQDLAAYMEADWDSDFERPPGEFFEHQACQAFERSLALRPELLDTHIALSKLWMITGHADRAANVTKGLLSRFPDHEESLKFLADYYESLDDFQKALDYVTRLREVKPLDEYYRTESWELLIHLARAALRLRDWTTAQRHLDTAISLSSQPAQMFRCDTLRAFLERQNGTPEQYEAMVASAKEKAGHAAPVEFALTIDAATLGLPQKVYRSVEEQFLAELEKPFDTTAAGLMAQLALSLANSEKKYNGQVKHTKALTDYLKGGTKSTFELIPLRYICAFLSQQGTQKTLLDRFLMHGRARFRTSGFFDAYLGFTNFDLGPDKCDRDYTKQMLTDAQKKILVGNDLFEKTMLPQIERTLAILEDYDEFEDDDEFYFDDDDDDDFDEQGFAMQLRRELDRQLAKHVRPGLNVAIATPKDMRKISSPQIMEEITANLSKETGLTKEYVTTLLEKLGGWER
jgi:tetratricopeptide (TPR) repeat protein